MRLLWSAQKWEVEFPCPIKNVGEVVDKQKATTIYLWRTEKIVSLPLAARNKTSLFQSRRIKPYEYSVSAQASAEIMSTIGCGLPHESAVASHLSGAIAGGYPYTYYTSALCISINPSRWVVFCGYCCEGTTHVSSWQFGETKCYSTSTNC